VTGRRRQLERERDGEQRVLDLETAIADVVGLLRARAALQLVNVRHQVPTPAPGLTVEPATFKQVLYILLENAIAFAPPASRVLVTGGAVLGIRTAGRPLVMITVVADVNEAVARGSTDYAERGYEQLEPSSAVLPAGSHGRRLATARTVAEILGGTLRVSLPAGQVAFTWLLPASPGAIPHSTNGISLPVES
jgi:signal transduction histidine kinase